MHPKHGRYHSCDSDSNLILSNEFVENPIESILINQLREARTKKNIQSKLNIISQAKTEHLRITETITSCLHVISNFSAFASYGLYSFQLLAFLHNF